MFRDPNVLGRYLALAIVALGAWIAWRRPERQAIAGALVAAFLLLALSFTFSQTSFAALIARPRRCSSGCASGCAGRRSPAAWSSPRSP